MAMSGARFDYSSVLIRFLFSLFFVLAAYNPTGVSYYHWLYRGEELLALKVFVGLVLFSIYVVLAVTTWRMMGALGIGLVAVVCAAAGWLFWELGIVDLSSVSAVLTGMLIMVAVVFTVGISYSGAHTRLAGVLHTQIK
ncbi:MAG: hypothetical protein IT561_19885 [Alphaproteobacteria bacterium]|nr:hypothetical protein [Alphaproteobacteria bacterium]